MWRYIMQNLVGHRKEVKSILWIKFIIRLRSSRRLLENRLLSVSPGSFSRKQSSQCDLTFRQSTHIFEIYSVPDTHVDLKFLLWALPTFINPHTHKGPCMSFLVLRCSEIESYYTQYYTTYILHLAKYCGHFYQLVDKIHSYAIFLIFPFCSDFLNMCASTIHCHHPQPLALPNIHFGETLTWYFKYYFEKA